MVDSDENSQFSSLPPESKTFSSIALFDLDHTLLSASSSFSFGRHLYRRGFFSTSLMLSMASLYACHRLGFVSIKSLQQKIFQRLFKGKSHALFFTEANLFLKDQLNGMLYQPAINELKIAKANGSFVAILSSAPDLLVSLISKELGIEHFEATTYEIDQSGNYSHISHFFLGDEKAAYSLLCADRLHVDKSHITAYTDSHLDLPMMQSAGQRVAVRPDRKLKAISIRNHWRVI